MTIVTHTPFGGKRKVGMPVPGVLMGSIAPTHVKYYSKPVSAAPVAFE
jgi:hypothetical protein